MIDLNELEKAINRCAFDGDALGLSKAECRDLLTRLRQAEKDAARYRWLRDGANYHKHSGPLVFITDSNGNIDDFNGHSGVLSEMDLDHEVDEAMQCK